MLIIKHHQRRIGGLVFEGEAKGIAQVFDGKREKIGHGEYLCWFLSYCLVGADGVDPGGCHPPLRFLIKL